MSNTQDPIERALPQGRVELLRPFWGHMPGAKGTIFANRLHLRGSSPARVYTRDIDHLFRYLTQPAPIVAKP